MQKLDPHQLQAEMILAEAVRTPSGQTLANAGEKVTRQLINRMKLYRVEYACVEDSPDINIAVAEVTPPVEQAPTPVVPTPAPTPVAPPPAKPTVSAPKEPEEAKLPKTYIQESKTTKQKVAASDEFQVFQLQYYSCIETLKRVFHETIEQNKPIETEKLLEEVASLFRSRNTIIELFDMLNNLRGLDDSVYVHSLNVALISRMLGRWLKLDSHDLDILTLAGLFHDIGKCKIPDEILNKPGKLSEEEFTLVKSHPKLGYDILRNQNISSRIKKAALMHHERCDGSGYPSHLEEDLIDEFAMIVAIADVYDAMTAARAYRAPLCAFQVIANFEKEGFQKYHTKYILTFLKQIAATYQSNRVILSDGRRCNIVMLNQSDLARPMVQFDDNSVLDLSTQRDLFITAIV